MVDLSKKKSHNSHMGKYEGRQFNVFHSSFRFRVMSKILPILSLTPRKGISELEACYFYS